MDAPAHLGFTPAIGEHALDAKQRSLLALAKPSYAETLATGS